jgi:large subunit ribosomal protein L13
MKTYVAKPSDRQRDWYVVDASGKTLGRLATQIAHSGYPGGLRTRTFDEMIARRPEEVIRLAVKGMMPRNRLARKQLTKLKIYAGAEHPHVAQKPTELELRP